MLPKPLRVLWGNLTLEEVKKFGILAATLFLIIGVYWMLRVMKDATFGLFVGYKEYQPYAKIASIFFVLLAVLIYSKLVDVLSKQRLFYFVCLFYGLGFLGISYFFLHPDLVTVTNPTFSWLFSWIPGKPVGGGFGWLTYLFLESFGSIVVAMFWSFVASTTSTESAKRGYGMIMSITQFGTILGPWIVQQYAKTLGLPKLYALGGVIVCCIPLLILLYMFVVPQEPVTPGEASKPKTGLFEGLKLLCTRSYLIGILVVATMYEVISTIVEYQMGVCIDKVNPATADGGGAFATVKAWNGMAIGFLSLLFALLGTSFFMRKFGLKFCLITFPVTIGITVTALYFYWLTGAQEYQLMWAFFIAVVIFKGLNYALNNPTKEVLYIPTSKDVKYKAKAWIDAFGNRSSKAVGGLITSTLGASLPTLIAVGTFVSLGIVGFWVVMAAFTGNMFEKLQTENKIVE